MDSKGDKAGGERPAAGSGTVIGNTRGDAMTTPRILLAHRSLGIGGFSTAAACAVCLRMAYADPDTPAPVSAQAKVGNPITGAGLPNPAPKVTRNWGEL